MNIALERLVWQREEARCEYCQLLQAFSPLPHAIGHIISQQQHDPTVAENLALGCFFCNSYRSWAEIGEFRSYEPDAQASAWLRECTRLRVELVNWITATPSNLGP
jgi:hypothetical protein